MIEIDTTGWHRGFDSISFDLTSMSFNGIHWRATIGELSILGQPDHTEKSILHYYDIGITALTNTRTTPYFYIYARDNCHGFGLKSKPYLIGEAGGPYQCFHADFTLNGKHLGRDIHLGNAERLLRAVSARETPASNPEKFRNYNKRISLNDESNHSIDLCYNADGILTHMVLT